MTELQNYRMTELQNDRMTDRTKTICPPIFDLGGIKISSTQWHTPEMPSDYRNYYMYHLNQKSQAHSETHPSLHMITGILHVQKYRGHTHHSLHMITGMLHVQKSRGQTYQSTHLLPPGLVNCLYLVLLHCQSPTTGCYLLESIKKTIITTQCHL